MLRRLLERASRGIVLRRRLPLEHGGARLFVSPDAGLKYWLPGSLRAADPALLSLTKELVGRGSRIWDVGANVGLFAFAAASHAGPRGNVLAIEPDPWLARLITRSAALQSSSSAPVKVVQAAVADRDEDMWFEVASRARAASHLVEVAGSTQAGGARSRLLVAAVRLDTLLATESPPDVVKIDVEGAEHLCLRGATELLRTVRPPVVCEVGEQNRDEVEDIFLSTGYRMFDAYAPPDRRVPLEAPVWNTLALPLGSRFLTK